MIVPMQRVFVAARRRDATGVVSRLRDYGVVHITPVEPGRARPDDAASARLDRGRRALLGLELAKPVASPVAVLPSAEAIVDEVDTLVREKGERSVQRAALAQQVERTGPWQDTAPGDLEALARRGVRVRLFRVPVDALGRWMERAARFGAVEVLREQAREAEVLLVSSARFGEAEDFEVGEEVPWPTSDRAALRAEAAVLAAADDADQRRLGELAHGLTAVREHVADLEESAEDSAIIRAGLRDEALIAYAGWVPEDRVATLKATADADRDVPVAWAFRAATLEESPPTLVRYPRWAQPIAGLLDLLNTRPGYRELDIGLFFMVALPVFAALLIGDAIYGLLFVVGGLVARRRRPQLHAIMSLMIVVGAVTVVWGVLVANYGGLSPETLARWAGFTVQESGEAVGDVRGLIEGGSGFLQGAAQLMLTLAPLYPLEANGSADTPRAQELIIMVSFCMGATHLVAARLSRAWVRLPGAGGWTEIGWALFLIGMLGIVWAMFFPEEPLWPPRATAALMISGAVLFILFTGWGKGVGGFLGAGVAGNLLPVINTFSDTMSYIRLMAVGLASQYIAVSFNLLAEQIAGESHWALSAPVLLFGHSLNVALCVIAIFAHGVRLNMLEFSSNAGVWWAGFAYAPLRRQSASG